MQRSAKNRSSSQSNTPKAGINHLLKKRRASKECAEPQAMVRNSSLIIQPMLLGVRAINRTNDKGKKSKTIKPISIGFTELLFLNGSNTGQKDDRSKQKAVGSVRIKAVSRSTVEKNQTFQTPSLPIGPDRGLSSTS